MQLLVTTSQSFLLLDTDSGVSIPLDRGRGLYYGIAIGADQLYVAARKRPVSSAMTQTEERGEILIFDRALQACGSLQAPFPLRDLHEIAWHNDRLWATCSHDNMVAIYDGNHWEQWFPLGGNFDDASDINHFNSFRFEGDRVWVLAHNRGDSELLAFSLETRELVERVPLGHCAHNIWLEDDQLFTCSSLEGRIMGNQGFRLETGGFPRGVAFGKNLRCIGISAMAERAARDFTTGKLMLFDWEWTIKKEIVLADEGLILDIQILPDGYRNHTEADVPGTPLATESSVVKRRAAPSPTGTRNMHDLFYSAFEERNRGSRDLIKSRLVAYLPFIEPLLLPDQAGYQVESARAIDLGCGRGEWLEILTGAGFDAEGVDLDEGMLAGCHQHGLKARCADALQALGELPAGSMALVSAFHVIEHIPFDDVRRLVREALRVLKPGGLLILESPNPENLNVGTSLFYLDPSHLRPIPPELLCFAVEFEGFCRNVVARLQEQPHLHAEGKIELINVLAGVSPDYGVVAQKDAAPELLSAFDPPFHARYGITLAEIAHRYEQQTETRQSETAARTSAWMTYAENRLGQGDERFSYLMSRDTHLETRIDRLETWLTQTEHRLMQSEDRAAQLGAQLLATLNSRSWRITAPLRWITNQFTLLRQDGLKARTKAMIRKIAGPLVRKSIGFINARPRLRQHSVYFLRHTGLYRILKPLYFRLSGQPHADDNTDGTSSHDTATMDDLTPRAHKIYNELKTRAEQSKDSR